MRAAEEAAFARGVEVEALMDKAGAGVAQAVTRFFRQPGKCIVFAGKGNNAGDALVAAECLRRLGWKIEVRLAFQEADCSGLMRKKLESLRRRPPEILGARPSRSGGSDVGVMLVELFAEAAEGLSAAQEAIAAEAYIATAAPLIILDGLLGLGAKPPLRDPIRGACRSINQLRTNKGAYVFAVDLPTGLDGESGKADRDCVIADFTVTIGFPKPGLLADDALNLVVFVPEEIYEIVAGAAPMESMVKPLKSYHDLLKEKVDVWAVGPGLGKSRAAEVFELIEKAKQPMVIDADSLNILAEKISTLKHCKGKRLLTPHPGEMKRLSPDEKETRAKTATKFCQRFPVTLLLKGSRTIVAERDRALSYNTTGNPGMATGGMGDILTGVCAGLLGQGLSPYDAARLGAWLCGRAAEIAIFGGSQSEQSLLPRDVLDHLGDAFHELKS